MCILVLIKAPLHPGNSRELRATDEILMPSLDSSRMLTSSSKAVLKFSSGVRLFEKPSGVWAMHRTSGT